MTDASLTPAHKLITTLLNAVTTNQTSDIIAVNSGPRTVQASITGSGTVSGTVSWYGSNINSIATGVLLATSTLSGTNSDNTGALITPEWPYMYCILTSITGTNAAVTATIGE